MIIHFYTLLLSFLIIYPRLQFFSAQPFFYYAVFFLYSLLSLLLVLRLRLSFALSTIVLSLLTLFLNIYHFFICDGNCLLDPIGLFVFPAVIFLSFTFCQLVDHYPAILNSFAKSFIALSSFLASFIFLSFFKIVSFSNLITTENDAFSTSTGVFLARHTGFFGEPAGASAILSFALLLCLLYRKNLLAIYFVVAVLMTLSLGGLLALVLVGSSPFYFLIRKFFRTRTISRRLIYLSLPIISLFLFVLFFFLNDQVFLLFVRLSSLSFGDTRTLSPGIALSHAFSSNLTLLTGSGLSRISEVLSSAGIYGFNTTSFNYSVDLIFSYGLPYFFCFIYLLISNYLRTLGFLDVPCLIIFLIYSYFFSLAGWSFSTFYPYLFLAFLYLRFVKLSQELS